MPTGKKKVRAIPGSPAARRKAPVTIMTVHQSGVPWTQVALPVVSREAQARGWRLLRHWQYSGTRPKGVKINGALADCGPENEDVRDLLQDGCPVVRLGYSKALGEPGTEVLHDSTAGGRMAADHFSDRGFHHVGFAEGPPYERYRPVLEGFEKQSDALGMTCHVLRLKKATGDAISAYETQYLAWLQRCPKPLGLFAFSDFRAAQFCYWAVQAGVAVPTDIAILGRGNAVSICECTWPTLSSIEFDEERRVRTACRLLSGMMAGDPAPVEPIMIPPKGVVVRESTNVLATSDPKVAAALRYMWDHLDLDLSVDAIAHEVGVSRRTLECAFRKHLRRGINAELRRKRLEVFRELLISSDTPIADLASMVGFRTLVHLQRSFRRAYGMSPRKFRALAKRSAR